ncbi:MAG: hypothetical protein ABR608_15225 [Pseudonocardiaceae bacterium]
MIVDCDCCVVRGDACAECVVTVLLGAPPGGLELDGTDRRALDTLAAAGMVPRLQLVKRDGNHTGGDEEAGGDGTDTDASRQRAQRSVPNVKRSERHAG